MKEKEFIKSNLRQIFTVARVGVEDGAFTQEEINAFISEEAQKIYKHIDEMPQSRFMLFCLQELLESAVKLEEKLKEE